MPTNRYKCIPIMFTVFMFCPRIMHICKVYQARQWHWPLIGQYWSRDLDTGLWLVRVKLQVTLGWQWSVKVRLWPGGHWWPRDTWPGRDVLWWCVMMMGLISFSVVCYVHTFVDMHESIMYFDDTFMELWIKYTTILQVCFLTLTGAQDVALSVCLANTSRVLYWLKGSI